MEIFSEITSRFLPNILSTNCSSYLLEDLAKILTWVLSRKTNVTSSPTNFNDFVQRHNGFTSKASENRRREQAVVETLWGWGTTYRWGIRASASWIRLNFLAKKEAAKEQFSKDDASRKSSKQLSCTTSQQSSASIAHQQPSLLQSNSMEASVEVHYSNIKSSSEGTQSSAPQSLLWISCGQN